MTNDRPVKKYKVGAVQVAIWENDVAGSSGSRATVHSVSLERRYKDEKGSWQSSGSLREADLPRAILALNKAFEFVALKDVDQDNGGERP